MFDHILVMTEGGPGTSSMVMALYAYSKSFEQTRIAYGNTISIGILIISLFFIILSKVIIGGRKVKHKKDNIVVKIIINAILILFQ